MIFRNNTISIDMTIEEIRDLIDSTINENGAKAITGKALNLALNELVGAVEEAAQSGGSSAERVYVNIDSTPLTDEQKAHNADLYTTILAAFEAGELIAPLAIIATAEGAHYQINIISVIYNGEAMMLFGFSDGAVIFILSSDGNVTIGG